MVVLAPGHLLVVNSGSSSLKLSLFTCGEGPCTRVFDADSSHLTEDLQTILSSHGLDLSTIRAVGHRFVHGGPRYTSSIVITDAILQDLETLNELAPLHNPACLKGIQNAKALVGPQIPQVAVFDTAFHRTMPPQAHMYGINRTLAKQYSIQRYGFHGIAHAYLWQAYSHHNTAASSTTRVITLQLGNGCSMAAIVGGISVDTSMGFTPAEGLLMGTRAGNIDAGAVEYLCRRENKNVTDILNLLNTQSGLLGVSEASSDMRQLLATEATSEGARLAIELFCYRALSYLGAYMAVLGGVDAILFSGGIGENAPTIRERILHSMSWCGIHVDDELNQQAIKLHRGQVRKISNDHSTVDVCVIGVDENSFIAAETQQLLQTTGESHV